MKRSPEGGERIRRKETHKERRRRKERRQERVKEGRAGCLMDRLTVLSDYISTYPPDVQHSNS